MKPGFNFQNPGFKFQNQGLLNLGLWTLELGSGKLNFGSWTWMLWLTGAILGNLGFPKSDLGFLGPLCVAILCHSADILEIRLNETETETLGDM